MPFDPISFALAKRALALAKPLPHERQSELALEAEVDAKISSHTAIAGAHHEVVTLANVDSKIAAHDVAEAVHGLATGEYLAKSSRSDQLVSRDMMEYPTENVSIGYLTIIGKAKGYRCHWLAWTAGYICMAILCVDSFADKSIEGWCSGNQGGSCIGRYSDENNLYATGIDPGATTEDFTIAKFVAGTFTKLASEAVDINGGGHHQKLSISGTTLSGYRDFATTPQITATDTDLASGLWGITPRLYPGHEHGVDPLVSYLGAPSSSSPEVLGYFEVPIVGKGTRDDPYRPKMPELIEDDPVFGKVNRLALSWSALIPTPGGKLLSDVCVVRIFKQSRQKHLRSIQEALKELRMQAGVKEIDKEEAKKKAKEIDKRLKDKDLEGW